MLRASNQSQLYAPYRISAFRSLEDTDGHMNHHGSGQAEPVRAPRTSLKGWNERAAKAERRELPVAIAGESIG
jgi:hypothetical protein